MKKYFDSKEVAELFEREDVIMLNVLPFEVYREEHIPHSLNACVYKVSFLDQVKDLGLEKSSNIILYENGPGINACLEARKKLEQAGYKTVSIYKDGLEQWKKKGGKTTKNKSKSSKPASGIYSIDKKESWIEWMGRNPIKKHHGVVAIKSAEARLAKEELKNLDLVIDMRKIKNLDMSGNKFAKILEKHLSSEDFFDVKKHPEARLEILRPHKLSETKQRIKAYLTLKSKRRILDVDGYITFRDKKLFITFHTDIDRTNWGVNYGSSKIYSYLLGHMVNDNISLDVRLVFKK